jgi:hypothetical protein
MFGVESQDPGPAQVLERSLHLLLTRQALPRLLRPAGRRESWETREQSRTMPSHFFLLVEGPADLQPSSDDNIVWGSVG